MCSNQVKTWMIVSLELTGEDMDDCKYEVNRCPMLTEKEMEVGKEKSNWV